MKTMTMKMENCGKMKFERAGILEFEDVLKKFN